MKAVDISKIYLKINQSETVYVSAICTHTPRDQLDEEVFIEKFKINLPPNRYTREGLKAINGLNVL